jgi:hypothetical protein
MSKSKKLPVIKDGPRNYKKSSAYWRTVRRVTKEKVKYLNEELEDNILPDPQEIVNDYDYSDYRFDFRFRDDEISEKESRK